MAELSYDHTLERDLSKSYEVLRQKSPMLIGMIGMGNEATNTKHEWEEFQTTQNSGVLAAAGLSAGATAWTPTTATFSNFAVGQILAIATPAGLTYAERVRVTAVNTSTITVSRGWGATTAGTITASSTVKMISNPKLENSAKGDDDTDVPTIVANYTQIFAKTAVVSRTAQNVNNYLNMSPIQFAEMQHLDTLNRDLNNALIYGTRETGSASVTRTAGGMFEFITSSGNVVTAGATALTSAKLNSLVKAIIEDGGTPDTIVCSPGHAQTISGWNSSVIQTARTDTTTGYYTQRFQSSLGMMAGGGIYNIVPDFNMPMDQLLLVDSSRVKLVPLRGGQFRSWDATTPGQDGIARRILGEYTFEIRDGLTAHGLITNLKPA